jgi:hypothetical protein
MRNPMYCVRRCLIGPQLSLDQAECMHEAVTSLSSHINDARRERSHVSHPILITSFTTWSNYGRDIRSRGLRNWNRGRHCPSDRWHPEVANILQRCPRRSGRNRIHGKRIGDPAEHDSRYRGANPTQRFSLFESGPDASFTVCPPERGILERCHRETQHRNYAQAKTGLDKDGMEEEGPRNVYGEDREIKDFARASSLRLFSVSAMS